MLSPDFHEHLMNGRSSADMERATGSRIGSPSRVLVVSEQRYETQSQPRGVVAALRRSEVDVRERILPDSGSASRALADLAWAEVVVARGRSEEVLSVLDAAAQRGIGVVDRPRSIRAVRNKVFMSAVLARGQIPTPATYVGATDELAVAIPTSQYPLILKPIFGDNARGLRLVNTPSELAAVQWRESPALVQEFLPSDGVDLKLYCIGTHVWAVRKPSPFTPCRVVGACLVAVDEEMERIARSCGRLFGLTVFGVDCVSSRNGAMVIEVNDFPNFTSVPRASELLANHVLAAARSVEGLPA